MTDLAAIARELEELLGTENVLLNEPMSKHTSFEIGGPAAVFAMPANAMAAARAVALCRTLGAPYFVLGNGSDLLVSDAGFAGVVISLTQGLTRISSKGTLMRCEAGADMRDASAAAAEKGLSGLEFACGIPGSIGGGCFMNAGAYGGCIADVLESVEVLLADGTVDVLDAQDLEMGYRKSRIASEGMVVLAATFKLVPASPEAIASAMDDLMAQRQEKQPLEYPSAGSTFKRPEGYFAGKLISDAGLKGYRVGGAAVSEKHAGFVVNLGGATAADVHAVIEHVQDEVEKRFGVRLEPEVRFVG